MTPEEKAAAIAAAVGTKTLSFSYGGLSFQVSGCYASGPAVYVTVSAWTGAGGNRVFLPVDNPYVFVNPPLQVPDGGTDAQGNPTYTRNDVTAAKTAVYDAVTLAARRLGWAG